MTTHKGNKPEKSNVRIDIVETFGWRRFDTCYGVLWLKGTLIGLDTDTLGRNLIDAGLEGASESIATLHGNFAVVFETADWTLAATDRVGSIPLSFAHDGDNWVIDSEARRLSQKLGLTESEPDALISIAMAGYTIGRSTFYRDLSALEPGETVTFSLGRMEPERNRYYVYRPYSDRGVASSQQLLEVTQRIFEKMISTLDGRTVMVPLSAGLDSRLVVSALYEFGYSNVRCFSYGQLGNHEAEAGRRIAEHLGYPWTFIANSPRQQEATFASVSCQAFVAFADTLQAIPFQQDFYAVGELKRSGFAPEDAIFVNGQSGDYISGNHIPQILTKTPIKADVEVRWGNVFEAMAYKQFDLWASLKTEENLARLDGLLRDEFAQIDQWFDDTNGDYSIFEIAEFRNRQSKYVVAGQRTYEWFGFDWRLPLWDRDYLDFWADVPLADKAGQRLYREMLVTADWGGVWGHQWKFKRRIVPTWISFLRFIFKVLHAPLGRSRWHRFERRYIEWWTDVICNYSIVPYGQVLRDRCGHRNAIAWHARRYLQDKGYGIDGLPIESIT